MDEEELELAGLDDDDDDDDDDIISGPADVRRMIQVMQKAQNAQKLARYGSRLKPAASLGKARPVVKAFKKLSLVTKQALEMADATQVRRPTCVGGGVTAAVAPGGTTTLTFLPGGQNKYELLNFRCSEEVASSFAVTSLFIGGQQHVFNVQTAPVVANAGVPMTSFVWREDEKARIRPWTGLMFDATQPITFSVTNITLGWAGGAQTVARTLAFAVEAQIIMDPCAQQYGGAKRVATAIGRGLNRGITSFFNR